MVLTQNQNFIRDLFDILPYHSDSDQESNSSVNTDPNMSSTTLIDDNTNPYSQTINLKDKTGLSLFREACKGLDDDDKVDLTIENAKAFKEEVDRAAADFCWGTICSDIPNDAGKGIDLLDDYKNLKLTNVKNFANVTWGCTTGDNKIPAPPTDGSFTAELQQRQIRSTMMAKWIRKSVKKPDQKTLDLSKKLFQYKHSVRKTIEEDGPLMLKILYDRINPSTRVGVRNLITNLFKFNLKDYNQDVPKMADKFEETYNLILEKEEETVKPEAPFFDALLTCTNQDFLTGIKTELTKWESGADMPFINIKSDAITKFNNISERLKKDGKTFSGGSLPNTTRASFPHSDEQAKIVALRTELEDTKRKLASAYLSTSNSIGDKTSNSGGINRKPNVDAWRMKKTFGEKFERDGRTYYWCPHHKYPPHYDGLYVNHPPEKHAEWKDKQDRFKGRGKYAKNQSSNPSTSGSTNEVKLVLSDDIKQALITDHGFNALQIKQLERSGN